MFLRVLFTPVDILAQVEGIGVCVCVCVCVCVIVIVCVHIHTITHIGIRYLGGVEGIPLQRVGPGQSLQSSAYEKRLWQVMLVAPSRGVGCKGGGEGERDTGHSGL